MNNQVSYSRSARGPQRAAPPILVDDFALEKSASKAAPILDSLMTPDEVARCLKLPKSTVLAYQRRGVLPSISIGKHVRFLRADVEAAIIELAQNSRRGTTRVVG